MHRRAPIVAALTLLTACSEAPNVHEHEPARTRTRPLALDMGMTGTDMPNTVPEAVDDEVTVDEDDEIVIDVLANDVDADGDMLTVFVRQPAVEGIVTKEGDQFRYAPRANFNGTDAFTYQVLDGQGGTAEATVNITVAPVNDPPRFAAPTPDNFATFETTAGTSVTFPLAGTDIDGDSLMFGYEDFGASEPPTADSSGFRWTPGGMDVGLHDVEIFVSDATDRDARSVTIEVFANPDNCGGRSCADDEVCFGDACFLSCEASADCDGGACFDGRCAGEACAGVSCATGSCYLGGCFEDCSTAADCSTPNAECFQGRCAESVCDGIVCSTEQVCRGGRCLPQCDTVDDCSGDFFCIAGACAAPSCDEVACGAGSFCQDGQCVACEGGSCGADNSGDQPRFESEGGCGCSSGPSPAPGVLFFLLLFSGVLARRIGSDAD